MQRLVFLLTIGALCSLGLVTPVLAASPGNDAYGGRTVIEGLPFGETIDTTEATTDALDAEANLECGAPATDASVWYELTPENDGEIVIDATASDYSVGILVLTGSPGTFSAVACVAGSLGVTTTAGETLTILVFDYDDVGNGGNLVLSMDALPPPPSLELTIDRDGTVNQRTGIATVHGTITCTGGSEYGKYFIEGQLTQAVGRFRIHSDNGSGTFTCTGTAEAWSFELVGLDGRLGGGKATVSVFAAACTFSCSTVVVDRVITLKR
jgi:hypothetical protein